MTRAKRTLLVVAVVALYVLHQDFWFWRTARPLLFGFLPPGLAYHAGFTLAAALLMWLLVREAWPARLEAEAERHGEERHGEEPPGEGRAR
jgi:hypothetical protein